MYLEITDRTIDIGNDMSLETFKKALLISDPDFKDMPLIIEGTPIGADASLHPNVVEMVNLAVEAGFSVRLRVIGKGYEAMKVLIPMAREGKISLLVDGDLQSDPELFSLMNDGLTNPPTPPDSRKYRAGTQKPATVNGLCAVISRENFADSTSNDDREAYPCHLIFVEMDGTIYNCMHGQNRVVIGNVDTGIVTGSLSSGFRNCRYRGKGSALLVGK